MGTTFQSQHRNFKLYLDSPTRKVEPNGNVSYSGGLNIPFENGVFSTDDHRLANRLRNHRAHGQTFHEVCPEKVPAGAKGGDDKKGGGKTAA